MFKRACAVAGLALSAPAFGQIITIGPFTGDASENFNLLPFPVFVPQFAGLFDGNVDFNSLPLGSSDLHAAPGWAFIGVINARSAPRLVGSAAGPVEWVFHTPVTRVGGYFGSNTDVPDGTIRFFDEHNNQLGPTLTVTALNTPSNNVAWTWNGWESTGAPIARAVITQNNSFGGGWMMHDDMEISFGAGGCEGDFNGDNQVDFFDYLDFAVAFDAEDPSADFNGDNQVDFFDYLDFAIAFDSCQ